MVERSKPPYSDRMGSDILQPDAQKPKLVGFLRIEKRERDVSDDATSRQSGGFPINDFHRYAGRRFWCTFDTAPVVGEECVVHISGNDRIGGGEAHGVRWLVHITVLDSNNAETRYREARGNVEDERNVAGQFHANGWIIRDV